MKARTVRFASTAAGGLGRHAHRRGRAQLRGGRPSALTRHQAWLSSDAGTRAAAGTRKGVGPSTPSRRLILVTRARERCHGRARCLCSPTSCPPFPLGFVQALPQMPTPRLCLVLKMATPSRLEQAALRAKGEASRRLKAKRATSLRSRISSVAVGASRRLESQLGARRTSRSRRAARDRRSIRSSSAADTGNPGCNDTRTPNRGAVGHGSAVTPLVLQKGAFYAAGNEPSDKPGGFLCPLAIERVPGRVSDTIVVLMRPVA